MPELIFSLCDKVDSGLIYVKGGEAIIKVDKTYQDLLRMFGSFYEMPPESEFEKRDEIVYRCPYNSKCPAGANCFVVAAPEPLQERTILNVKCRLCRNQKIPIYAGPAANWVKKGI